jgi:hypothetical protein
VLPEGKPNQEAAQEILRILLLNRELIEFIVIYRVAFGVKLLALPVKEAHDFSDEYLTALISTPRSTSDAFDIECWEDPTFVVIQFFDLMVSAAEYQDIHWHMWLYYFPHILERLLGIYTDVGPGVDLEDEDPTRAAYIIQAMFRAMRDWITAVNHLPESSSQLTLDNERIDHENGNIPKSAILALGTCLRDLLLAETVGERFKQTIVDLVISGVGQLPRKGPRSAFRRVMIVSVVQGGPHWGPNDSAYTRRLNDAYLKMDYVLRERLDDLTSAMHEAC